MASVPVVTLASSRVGHSAGAAAEPPRKAARGVVAIAASTGGVFVLAELLRALDPARMGPVLVAQHMDADFQGYFAEWLSSTSRWPAVVVDKPAELKPGTLHLPSGGKDLVVTGPGEVSSLPASSRYVPSGDRLFTSAARELGREAVAVVLSGMGVDGAGGTAELIKAGGRAIAQLPSTAVVPSMPSAALKVGPSVVAVAPAMMPAVLLEAGALL